MPDPDRGAVIGEPWRCLDCGLVVVPTDAFQLRADIKPLCRVCFDRRIARCLVGEGTPHAD